MFLWLNIIYGFCGYRGQRYTYSHDDLDSLISKIGLDRASIFGKLKPTAAILEGPPEEYSGVTETKNKNSDIFY